MVYLIMGVSGAGKSTVGLKLAKKINAYFLDADNFHSPKNIEKMKRGIPLNDLDRLPWLQRINTELKTKYITETKIVIAFSALKELYRSILLKNIPDYLIVYLTVKTEILEKRLAIRKSHFFNPNLLASQINELETPKNCCIILDGVNSPGVLVKQITKVSNI